MPQRRYATMTTLRAAITAHFTTYEESLTCTHHSHPVLAAWWCIR
jgi:hypothetical protein